MRTLPISKVKDKLNEYVDSVAITRDQVTITKNGLPAAVLIDGHKGPGHTEADADIAAGRTHGEDEIRAEFGVPKRDN